VIRGLERQQPSPHGIEVLIGLDAHAPADEEARLATLEPSFPVAVRRANRPGASAARNAACRAARAPLILFLDDDIVPVARLVFEHTKWHCKNPEPEVGVLGAVRWSARVKVTPFMRWLETGIQFDYGTITSVDVEWQRFYSCNISVKPAMLERVGGFDEERFPFGYEDLELARRMSAHGLRLLYNDRALGEHLKTETLESWRRNLARIALAERRYTELYPDQRPYFYERFRAAADAPVARGRSARLTRFVAPGLPWLGRFVWRSYDLVCSQQLAPEFLGHWDAAKAAALIAHDATETRATSPTMP
jgi:glycosyltransferase involved in cell wall biosynthesis